MATNGKGDVINLKTPWTGDIIDSSWFHDPAMAKYRAQDNFKIPFWLQPLKYYSGAAWYQKDIDIKGWESKYIELFLERCHWETRVWIDGNEAGMENTLGAPHVYDLSKFLKPGKHKITIRVDNRMKEINVGVNSHSVSDHTQTNWNGIVGKLELRAYAPVHISDVQVYPNIQEKKIRVITTITNHTGNKFSGKLQLNVKPQAGGIDELLPQFSSFSVERGGSSEIEQEYPMGNNPVLWDEFKPNLYTMSISLAGGNVQDHKVVTFGMRDFKTRGTQFTINGRLTFLRGTLECAIFPRTGYPPTDTASWMRIFRIARAHGIEPYSFSLLVPS
jgi:beta-galactosidase/beta-glucuronidase